eukprot:scaffold10199_cov146-Cylindrotheca_fusiformis.AAC.15
MSPLPGSNEGVRAPNNKVMDATNRSRTGLATSNPLTNWATMAPILPDAAHTPIPVDRTVVGKSSLVMTSMVFHAMTVKH